MCVCVCVYVYKESVLKKKKKKEERNGEKQTNKKIKKIRFKKKTRKSSINDNGKCQCHTAAIELQIPPTSYHLLAAQHTGAGLKFKNKTKQKHLTKKKKKTLFLTKLNSLRIFWRFPPAPSELPYSIQHRVVHRSEGKPHPGCGKRRIN